MENKDLFDEVLGNLNTEDLTNVEEDEDIIPIKISTGETYLINSAEFDWEGAVNNLSQMHENEESLRNMMLSLLQITDPSEENAVNCINEIIKHVGAFLEGFQIVPDYAAFDPAISYYKKAMLLVYDATNAVRTIIHYTEIYEMLTNIQLDHNACDEHECCHCDDCSCEVREEPTIYKVTSMLNDNDELEIKSVEESFCTPDEIDIIDQDGDMVSVHVCGYNEEEAVNDAIEIFKANEYKVGGIE